MTLEAEVMPLFMGCSAVVLLLELLIGFSFLKGKKLARTSLVTHVGCTALSFFCLSRMLFFGPRTLPDGGPVNYSGTFGLFGICWTLSVLALLCTIDACIHEGA